MSKIKVLQSELSDALNILKKVIGKKTPDNFLKTFLFRAKEGYLTVTSTNLNESGEKLEAAVVTKGRNTAVIMPLRIDS